jgi:hypothetical protein
MGHADHQDVPCLHVRHLLKGGGRSSSRSSRSSSTSRKSRVSVPYVRTNAVHDDDDDEDDDVDSWIIIVVVVCAVVITVLAAVYIWRRRQRKRTEEKGVPATDAQPQWLQDPHKVEDAKESGYPTPYQLYHSEDAGKKNDSPAVSYGQHGQSGNQGAAGSPSPSYSTPTGGAPYIGMYPPSPNMGPSI